MEFPSILPYRGMDRYLSMKRDFSIFRAEMGKIEDISKNIIYPYRLFYFIWSSKQNSITIIDLFDYQTERNRSFEKINITFLCIDRNAEIDRSFFAIQYYPFDKPRFSSSTRILYFISTSATRFFSKKSWTNDLCSRAPSISDFPFSPFSIARVSAPSFREHNGRALATSLG